MSQMKNTGIITLFCILAMALPAYGATVTIGSYNVAPGGTVVVPLIATGVTNLASVTVNITYNPAVVSVTSIAPGTGNALSGLFVQNIVPGVARVSIIDPVGKSGNVTIANFTLNAVGTNGTSSPLDIGLVTFSNIGFIPITATVTGGSFTVGSATNVLSITANPTTVTAGVPTPVTFTVMSATGPVGNANIDLSGSAAGTGTTDGAGIANINVNASGAGTITATANHTGFINGTTTLAAIAQSVLSIAANVTTVTAGIPAPVTFTVTSGGLPVTGATVALGGNATGTATTDFAGNAVITVNAIAAGTITATATMTNFVSASATLTSTLPALSVVANPSTVIAGTPSAVTFNVTSNGASVSGAVVSLSGAGVSLSGTTLANGNVTISVNAITAGTITVTANKTNYTNGTSTLTALVNTGVTVTIGNYSVGPNGSAVASLMASGVTNLASVTVNLVYDPAVVNVTSVAAGTGNALAGILVQNLAPGLAQVSIIDPVGKSGNVIIADFTLNAIGFGGTSSPLNVAIVTFADVGFTPISAIVTGGTFNITALGTLNITASPTTVTAGKPTAVVFNVTNASVPFGNATVTLSGNATGTGTTAANGSVTISVNATSAGIITVTASRVNYISGITTLNALPGPGTIVGTIVYSNNGTGIPGVAVNLTNASGVVASIVTNAAGSFNFTNVIPGNYNLNVFQPRFFGNSTIVAVAAGSTNSVSLILWLKGDLNNNGVSADIGDLILMKQANIGEITPDFRYDLNNNTVLADIGDLILMKRANIGEITLV